MKTCPYCNHEVLIRELPHQGVFQTFRICPECNGRFTPDTKTKYLQGFFIFIAIISMVLTILLYFNGSRWLIGAMSSYVILGLTIYWGNKRMYLIPYHNESKTEDKSNRK